MSTSANSSFGHLINAILTENNGKILAKYKKTQSKHVKDLQNKFDEQREARKRAQERREMMDECHIIPDITYNGKSEKRMKKIATFGVVALFKAVAKHQRDLKRSLDEIDSDDDILQKKTMRIEHESTKRLLSSLNESSSNQQLIETPNPHNIENKHKKRKLNNHNNGKQNKLPKHLQSILLDSDESDDSDIDIDDDQNKKSKPKQWRVLDEDLMFKGDAKTKQQILDQDSEFEDESD